MAPLTPSPMQYYIGYNTVSNSSDLVGLSLSDGSIVTRNTLPWYLPGPDSAGVGQTLAAGLSDGSVIVGGQMSGKGAHVVGVMQPATGVYRHVASFPTGLFPVLSVHTPPLSRGLVSCRSQCSRSFACAVVACPPTRLLPVSSLLP
jgi:hypothetical protein